jgi:hypothetical protein
MPFAVFVFSTREARQRLRYDALAGNTSRTFGVLMGL